MPPRPFVPSDDEEPVFVLRAADIVAPDTVRAWADMAERCRSDERLVRRARDLANEMEAWARRHGHHTPTPPDVADRRAGRVTGRRNNRRSTDNGL